MFLSCNVVWKISRYYLLQHFTVSSRSYIMAATHRHLHRDKVGGLVDWSCSVAVTDACGQPKLYLIHYSYVFFDLQQHPSVEYTNYAIISIDL